MPFDPTKLSADIQAYSAVIQVAIAVGKLAGKNIRDFVRFLSGQAGEPMTNEQLDAITRGVMEQDIVRKALADAEAGGH